MTMHPYRDEATEALFQELGEIARANSTLFGMANANTLSYKAGFATAPDRSDCADIAGSHPAFVEDDFMWFSGRGLQYGRLTQQPRHLRALRAAHRRGAVTGFCWHLGGMKSHYFRLRWDWGEKQGELTGDEELAKDIVREYEEWRAVRERGLAGRPGEHLAWLYGLLDRLVIPVFRKLRFPLVFRPFHEMNGAWFWWGSEAIKPEEFITLYRLTVERIRDAGIRNILYAWSPNTPFDMRYYPGDEWVDILGLDTYEPGLRQDNDMENFVSDLKKLGEAAREQGKIAALTEVGCRKDGEIHRYPDVHPDFWTTCVLTGIKASHARLAYLMSWYQVDHHRDGRGHIYIPYRGIEAEHSGGKAAIDDFTSFVADGRILLERDLPERR